LTRNYDRFAKSYISQHLHLRIRVLACSRKNPKKKLTSILRMVARDYIKKNLQDATLAQVDELLNEFLSPASAISELRSASKPRFIIMTRKPEFRATKFPERDERMRLPSGRLQKRPFTPKEIRQLYFLHTVPSSSIFMQGSTYLSPRLLSLLNCSQHLPFPPFLIFIY